jgi:hypothetical protein
MTVTVSSITASKFLIRVPVRLSFNANHADHATSGDFFTTPSQRTGINIDSQRCEAPTTAYRWRFTIVPRIASINHVSREKTSFYELCQ